MIKWIKEKRRKARIKWLDNELYWLQVEVRGLKHETLYRESLERRVRELEREKFDLWK